MRVQRCLISWTLREFRFWESKLCKFSDKGNLFDKKRRFIRLFCSSVLFPPLLLLLATALYCIHVTKERVPCFKLMPVFVPQSLGRGEAQLQLLTPRYRDHAGTILYLSCLVDASYANLAYTRSLPCVIFGCEIFHAVRNILFLRSFILRSTIVINLRTDNHKDDCRDNHCIL